MAAVPRGRHRPSALFSHLRNGSKPCLLLKGLGPPQIMTFLGFFGLVGGSGPHALQGHRPAPQPQPTSLGATPAQATCDPRILTHPAGWETHVCLMSSLCQTPTCSPGGVSPCTPPPGTCCTPGSVLAPLPTSPTPHAGPAPQRERRAGCGLVYHRGTALGFWPRRGQLRSQSPLTSLLPLVSGRESGVSSCPS